jgi:hypothetical protein
MTNQEKKVLANIMKRHLVNIFKISQQSYLIANKKLNENKTIF